MFTEQEQEQLQHFVTDTGGSIFAVRNLPGMVGAIYARYSRAKAGFREVLLKEFVKEGVVDPAHAQELIDRILIAFGDDSVGELEGAHVSFENISMIATKEIEERRIGGSPIEQSTRYVFYDQKTEGSYRYHTPAVIRDSRHARQYSEIMDFVFATYCELIEPMKLYYQDLKPLEAARYDINGDGIKEAYSELHTAAEQKAFRVTYAADVRTKACDTLRALLPLATMTNVGVFGNGRFFQNVLTALYTSPYQEAREIGIRAHAALNKVIPVYVKRAARNEYAENNRRSMTLFAHSLLRDIPPQDNIEIDLLDYGDDAIADRLRQEPNFSAATLAHFRQDELDIFTVTCMLYEFARHPFRQLRNIVRKLSPEQIQSLIACYVGERRTRRDRPYRAFESGYPYTFDLTTDFGVYKDLMRHRMTSQMRQLFSPRLGFAMPDDLEQAGFAHRAAACHDRVSALYEALASEFPYDASYVTLHGHRVRWMLAMNDREAFHLLELRTTPQGHDSYRRVAQALHNAIRKRSPWRADAMKFVDHNRYFWTRGDAEARQRVKERNLDERRKQEQADAL